MGKIKSSVRYVPSDGSQVDIAALEKVAKLSKKMGQNKISISFKDGKGKVSTYSDLLHANSIIKGKEKEALEILQRDKQQKNLSETAKKFDFFKP